MMGDLDDALAVVAIGDMKAILPAGELDDIEDYSRDAVSGASVAARAPGRLYALFPAKRAGRSPVVVRWRMLDDGREAVAVFRAGAMLGEHVDDGDDVEIAEGLRRAIAVDEQLEHEFHDHDAGGR